MDTDDVMMCLRRFLNRCGEVIELRCDRGSNFVGAERELKEAINEWNARKSNMSCYSVGANGSSSSLWHPVCPESGSKWFGAQRQH